MIPTLVEVGTIQTLMAMTTTKMIGEKQAKAFPNSIYASTFDVRHGTNYSGRRMASRTITAREAWDAKWGRGPAAGKTGDCFVDDSFFNPWAPGGSFNK